jgi:hypothetical protein
VILGWVCKMAVWDIYIQMFVVVIWIESYLGVCVLTYDMGLDEVTINNLAWHTG